MNYKIISYFDGQIELKGAFYPLPDHPLLILFPAFEGPSEFCHTYASSFHSLGYQVFIADIYGAGHIGHTLDECFELIGPFLESRTLVRQRSLLAYEAAKEASGAVLDKIGCFGFCFGGMCSLELVRSGASLKAAASVHGLLKKSELVTHKTSAEILVLHGFQDPQVPASDLFAFADEMALIDHTRWQFTCFGGAKHSFTDPKTGTFDPIKEQKMGREYNPQAQKRSFAYLKLFFQELL